MWLAKVKVKEHTLILGDNQQWKSESDDPEANLLALQANVVAAYPAYSYSESDGRPGWVASNLVKESMGGEVQLNPATDVPYYGVGEPAQKTTKSLYDSPLYKRHK